MNTWVVALAYLVAVALACGLLYWFGARSWYWHVLSVVAALAIGLAPVPEQFRGPSADVTIGFVFLLLLIWGAGAPFVHRTHHEKHA
jgi:hypothetical protein